MVVLRETEQDLNWVRPQVRKVRDARFLCRANLYCDTVLFYLDKVFTNLCFAIAQSYRDSQNQAIVQFSVCMVGPSPARCSYGWKENVQSTIRKAQLSYRFHRS